MSGNDLVPQREAGALGCVGRGGGRGLQGTGTSAWASASSSCGFSLKLGAAVTHERPGWALPRSLCSEAQSAFEATKRKPAGGVGGVGRTS